MNISKNTYKSANALKRISFCGSFSSSASTRTIISDILYIDEGHCSILL